MDAVIFWFLSLVVIPVLIVVVMTMLAKRSIIFSEPERDHIVIVEAGETPVAIWPNTPGFVVSKDVDPDGHHWIVSQRKKGENEDPEKYKRKTEREWAQRWFRGTLWGTRWIQRIIWRLWRIRFVGWLWFQKKVRRIVIDKLYLEEKPDDTNKKKKDVRIRDKLYRKSDERDNVVLSLRRKIVRFVLVEAIEMRDNSKIDLLLQVIYLVVRPTVAAYTFKGKEFLRSLDRAVQAAVSNYFAECRINGQPLTLATWLETARGRGSPLEKALRKINVGVNYFKTLRDNGECYEYLCKLVGKEPTDGSKDTRFIDEKGLLETFGVVIESVEVVESQADEATKDLEKAVQAKQLAILTAEGDVAKSEGDRQVLRNTGQGESERLKEIIRVFKEEGIPNDQLAEALRCYLENQALPEAMKNNTAATTLFLGRFGGRSEAPAVLVNPDKTKGGGK